MPIHAATLDVRVIADTSAAEKGISGFDKTLQGAAKTMRNVGIGMSAAITAPIVGFVAAGLNMAMGFEQNMNIMQQVLGATTSEMSMLQEEALSLGASTVFSSNEAAEAMVELSKAGLDSTEVMEAIGGVMNLAAAGGIGLTESANITTAAIQAFGLEMSEADRVADLFAATANASTANVSDLSQGMNAAGFAFRLADQPIENLAASLAILSNNGLSGSDAGTALKNAFMRMMNPTQEAKKVMNELGISFYDINGNMKMLPDIIDNLNQATKGLTAEQRDAAMATIFMSDGMKAMMPLMDVGKEGLNAMVTEVTEVGAATDAADARMRGLSGGIEYLKGSVETFMTTAALPFLDTINGWVRGLGDAVTWFGSLEQPVINAGLAIAGVLAVAGPLLVAIGLMKPGLVAVGTALAAVGAPMIALAVGAALLAAAWATNFMGLQDATATAVTAVSQQLDVLKASMTIFGTSVKTAFSKTKFPSLSELWEDFKAGDFDTLATKIRTTAFNLMVNLNTELNITGKAEQLRQSIVTGINAAIAGIGNLKFSGVKSSFDTLRKSIQDTLATAFSGISIGNAGAAFAKIRANIQAALTNLTSGIDVEGAKAAFEKIKGTIQTELTGLLSGIDVEGLKAQFNKIQTSIQTSLTTAFNFDTGAIVASAKTGANNLRDSILGGLTTAISGMDFGKGGSVFSGLINKLTAAVERLDFSAINWSGVLQGALVGPAIVAMKGLNWVFGSDAFGNLKIAVEGAIGTIPWGELGTAFKGLGTAILGELGTLAADIASDLGLKMPEMPKLDISWKGVSESIVAGITGMTDKIKTIDWVGVGASVASALKTAVSTAATGLGAAFLAIPWGIDQVAQSLAGAIKNAFTNIQWGDLGNAIKGALGAVGNAIKDYFTGFAAELGITNPFDGVATTITTALESLGSSMSVSVSNAVADARSAARTAFSSLGESISIAVSNAVSHARDTVRTAFESLGSSIGTALTNAIDAAKAFVTTAFATLGLAIRTAISNAIAGATGGISGDEETGGGQQEGQVLSTPSC